MSAPEHRNGPVKGQRGRTGCGPRRLALPAGVFAALCLAALALPAPARAGLPNPIDALGGAVDAGLGAVTGGIGQLAVDGFEGIVKTLFAWPAKLLDRHVLAWLVAVPDYAIQPSTGPAGRSGSNLAQLGATTQAMAFGALGAVGTVAGVRFWAAGLTGSGGLEAFEGLGRTVAAALAIVLWPFVFRHAADVANTAARGLLGSGSVLDDTARMLAAAFAAAVAFNVLSILIAFAAAGLLLVLLVAKIATSAATALVFAGMPLALMLWPLPELAWITRAGLRVFAAVLAIPLAWALSFAAFAAVGVDALSFKGAGGLGDALLHPLVALALLWLTATLPRSLTRAALSGALGGAGGFASRTASRVVARRIDRVLVPGARAAHQRREPPSQPAPPATGAQSQRPGEGDAAAGRSRHAPVATGAGNAGAAAGAAFTPAAAATASAASVTGSGWRPPPAPGGAPGGLPHPSWQEIRDHVPVELDAAARRQATTTPHAVTAALRALPPAVAADVGALIEARGGQIRGQMAHQAARGELGEGEREAFRTLAAASPAVRTQGLAAYAAGPAEPNPAPPPPPERPVAGAAVAAPAPTGSAAAGKPGAPSAPPRDLSAGFGAPTSRQPSPPVPPSPHRPVAPAENAASPPPRRSSDGTRS
ncbi:MAG: hypothetical protein QOE28_2673 [Solirubrobacteraceae bacterium]|nr:hypothetical protein [Solirubrobacteraceae bacterium]